MSYFLNDSEQNEIFQKATHFNPADLVCGLKDYKGNKFDFSQELVQAGKNVRCWKLRMMAETAGHNFWPQLDEPQEEINTNDNREWGMKKLRAMKDEAFKHLRKAQKEHVEWLIDFPVCSLEQRK